MNPHVCASNRARRVCTLSRCPRQRQLGRLFSTPSPCKSWVRERRRSGEGTFCICLSLFSAPSPPATDGASNQYVPGAGFLEPRVASAAALLQPLPDSFAGVSVVDAWDRILASTLGRVTVPYVPSCHCAVSPCVAATSLTCSLAVQRTEYLWHGHSLRVTDCVAPCPHVTESPCHRVKHHRRVPGRSNRCNATTPR